MGTPNGIRAIITIGEEKGIIEDQIAKEELGCAKVEAIKNMDTIMGIVTGNESDCVSPSSVTAEPNAANWAP